jgi:hypothetical protein
MYNTPAKKRPSKEKLQQDGTQSSNKTLLREDASAGRLVDDHESDLESDLSFHGLLPTFKSSS